MAGFERMDSSPIRVVLPAGDAFVPAFVDAAATYSARKQHAADHSQAFVTLVELGCQCINSAQPSSVELTVSGNADRTTVTITGAHLAATLSKSAMTSFTRTATSAGATSSVDASGATIRFALEAS